MPFYVEKPKLGLNSFRQDVVEKAFAKLDRDGSGFLSLEEMVAVLDVQRHPLVVEGTMSPSQALAAFLRQFEPDAATRDGKITYDEFVRYYTKMSIEIDRGREGKKDEFFALIVRRSWKLDEDEMPTLAQTCIIPSTLDLPAGIARAKSMDLVWMCDDGKSLVGFKGAVKTVFARKDLPEVLRGFFALYGELERIPVSYNIVKAAVLPAYDFVWPTESGEWVGFKGVVSSNVTLGMLPDDLRALVKTTKESEKLNVAYMPTVAPVANPNFVKSSDIYGDGIMGECDRLARLKTSTFNGTAAGTKYVGRTGKFTNSMPPASPSAGLNCGTVKSIY